MPRRTLFMVSISRSTIKFLIIPPRIHPLFCSLEATKSPSATKSCRLLAETSDGGQTPSTQVAPKRKRRITRGSAGIRYPHLYRPTLCEIYTDPSKGSKPRMGLSFPALHRRFRHRRIVKHQDRLAHYDSATGNITVDQDPGSWRAHSWICFTTIWAPSSIVGWFVPAPAFASPRKDTAHQRNPKCSQPSTRCPTRGTELLERNGGNPGGFTTLGTNTSGQLLNAPARQVSDDRISSWDFPENCRDKKSTLRQRRPVSLYSLSWDDNGVD
jgi:hypothetical protein